MTGKASHRAFTLVELLIVIAIIAVLIAILLPAVLKARSSANVVACQSQMRQFGIAFTAYATANDGAVPMAYFRNAASNSFSWHDLIVGYLGNQLKEVEINSFNASDAYGKRARLFQCPSVVPMTPSSNTTYNMPYHGNKSDGKRAGAKNDGIAIMLDYTITANVGLQAQVWRMSEIRRPSEVLLLVEDIDGPLGSINSVTKFACYQNVAKNMVLHDGKFNYLFVDGHVAHLKPGETVAQDNVANRLVLGNASNGAWTVTEGD